MQCFTVDVDVPESDRFGGFARLGPRCRSRGAEGPVRIPPWRLGRIEFHRRIVYAVFGVVVILSDSVVLPLGETAENLGSEIADGLVQSWPFQLRVVALLDDDVPIVRSVVIQLHDGGELVREGDLNQGNDQAVERDQQP